MSEQVKLIALLKAKPGMSKKDFADYWINKHAPLTYKMKNLKGYNINIPIDDYQEIDGELPYDGTAELYWDSLEEMKEDFDSEAAAIALADADSFLFKTHIYTKEHVIMKRFDDSIFI